MNNPTFSTSYDGLRYDYEIMPVSDTSTNVGVSGEYLGEDLLKAVDAGYSPDCFFIVEYIEDKTHKSLYASSKKEALNVAKQEFYIPESAWDIDLEYWLE